MKRSDRSVGWATRATLAGAFSLALGACDLGYQGLQPIVDPGDPTGSCDAPAAASVRGIEVSRGAGGGFASPVGGTPFEALEDGDDLPIVQGSQGSDMVVLVLRVTGLDTDRCLPQQTTLVDADGTLVTRLARPVQFRAAFTGAVESGSLFLPGEFVPGPHTLTVNLGGVTLTRRLNVR